MPERDREAGRKADAHRVRNLYRAAFQSDSKMIARGRVIAALKAAGVTTVLDLWGGGLSALDLVAAGFRVIAVEDGSMELLDQEGRAVSRARKRRALEYAAAEGGYEARFGKAETFASEADGAYLDFCGPWTSNTRRAVTACRHMKCVAVTLTPDHDISSDASSTHERQMAYQLFLKMAWSDKPVWQFMQGGGGTVRRLLDYRRQRGLAVFLYLLSHKWISIPPVGFRAREKTRPDMHRRHLAIKRAWYSRLTPEQKRAKDVQMRERHKAKYDSDPVFRAHVDDQIKQRALRFNHRKHLLGVIPRVPCELCPDSSELIRSISEQKAEARSQRRQLMLQDPVYRMQVRHRRHSSHSRSYKHRLPCELCSGSSS